MLSASMNARAEHRAKTTRMGGKPKLAKYEPKHKNSVVSFGLVRRWRQSVVCRLLF